MKQTLVFRKLSAELEEVLMEELHTLKGGSGGNSENWLNEVEIIGEAPKEEEEEGNPSQKKIQNQAKTLPHGKTPIAVGTTMMIRKETLVGQAYNYRH